MCPLKQVRDCTERRNPSILELITLMVFQNKMFSVWCVCVWCVRVSDCGRTHHENSTALKAIIAFLLFQVQTRTWPVPSRNIHYVHNINCHRLQY